MFSSHLRLPSIHFHRKPFYVKIARERTVDRRGERDFGLLGVWLTRRELPELAAKVRFRGLRRRDSVACLGRILQPAVRAVQPAVLQGAWISSLAL